MESLQILSTISGNYFTDIMASYLPDISKAIENAFLDKHEDVLLHAGRAIEFIGQALDQHITNKCNYLYRFSKVIFNIFLIILQQRILIR